VVVWERLYAHLSEVFFGDTRTLAAVLHATADAGPPFTAEETLFGATPVLRVRGPAAVDVNNVYAVLRQVGGD